MKNGLLKASKSKMNKGLVQFQRKTSLWARARGLWNTLNQETSNYEKYPALVDSNLLEYTALREYKAYVTHNAYDMSYLTETNVIHHSNYGTIDNPNLVFGPDTTWRLVACIGPGSEEESSSHEKMYFVLREGPIHRCQFCGQCYKLVKLKDDITSEDNMYYSHIFTPLGDHTVADIEAYNTFTGPYSMSDPINKLDNPFAPKNHVIVFVSNDEGDRIMTDPAYRMKTYDEYETEFIRQCMVTDELETQIRLSGLDKSKTKIGKDVYETWFKIEKDILHFDRIYNRQEKFVGRRMFDPANHERREKRMLQRQKERLEENYTFYSGGLTEEEQQFRDYYETDLEEYRDDEFSNKVVDYSLLNGHEDLDMNLYSFYEGNVLLTDYTPVEDFIEKQLFKFRYRHVSDKKYNSRTQRVLKRFCERAKERDPNVVKDVGEKLEEIYVKSRNWVEVSKADKDELLPHAEYVANEGLQQFKDYYESDLESGEINKDILDDLPIQDKLRFSECFLNDLTKRLLTDKYYITIPKRPFDNKKSIVHNFVEDLVDFNYRVKPLARNLSFKDSASKYQSLPMCEEEVKIYDSQNDRYRKILDYKKSGKTRADHILTYRH